ncbi:MAG: hypothetical protein EBR55_00245 [Chitinophagia bacterium]|nr:hypothetical protein [Chitinophagia bacterium]
MNPFEKDNFYTNFTDINNVGGWSSLQSKFYPNNTSLEISKAINEVQEYLDTLLKNNRAKLQTFAPNERNDLKIPNTNMYIGDDTPKNAMEHLKNYLLSPRASWNQIGQNHLNNFYGNARDVITNYDRANDVLKDLNDKYSVAKGNEESDRKKAQLQEQQRADALAQQTLAKQQETIVTATQAKKIETSQNIKKYLVIGGIGIVALVVFFKVIKK